jgi:hypothetical protein
VKGKKEVCSRLGRCLCICSAVSTKNLGCQCRGGGSLQSLDQYPSVSKVKESSVSLMIDLVLWVANVT